MDEYQSRPAADHDACGVGFIAQLAKGSSSHEIIERALEALRRLEHRGGMDADARSGDGAGLLTSLPVPLFRTWASDAGVALPDIFAVGMVFLPKGNEAGARRVIEQAVSSAGASCLGWRSVPTCSDVLGPRALQSLPTIEQILVGVPAQEADCESLLFRIRKSAESKSPPGCYICSLSTRTIVYKGLLTPEQLSSFYSDLRNPEFASPFAVFHQRYSTNTRPSWSLAQPFRFIGHNGEINTVRGNRRWVAARRQTWLRTLGLPNDAGLLEAGVSDSASFDNALELLLRRGSDLPTAVVSMVPPASAGGEFPAGLERFLRDNVFRQEAWDGPAALVFSDGEYVGAKLDRNGLRPFRYTLTTDGFLIAGSEVGIADLSGKEVMERQRLGPGEMMLVNTATGAFLRPHHVWRKTWWPVASMKTPVLVCPSAALPAEPAIPARVLSALGWTDDQFRILFQPLVLQGKEAVWSMGDDAPPAFLSSRRRQLWDYCKQKFAQVTNPPIDPLRENHVMSLEVPCGDAAVLSSPVIDSTQLTSLVATFGEAHAIDCTFVVDGGVDAALETIARIRRDVTAAAETGGGIVLLTDRRVGVARAAVPVLLAVAAAWDALIKADACQIPLVVETGQAFDTHHFAMLLAVGTTAILPYAAWSMAARMHPQGPSEYRRGVEGGLRKVIARMGISTIASYRNSQLFETVGLDASVCAEFFPDADRVLAGKDLRAILDDAITTHNAAFAAEPDDLRDAGLYRFRREGERHANSPDVVRRMHDFIQAPTSANFRAFEQLRQQRSDISVRDLLEVVTGDPIPLYRVEPESSILARFSTQAMSLGAISPEAHRTLAVAMNRLGARSNTGEGGEDLGLARRVPEAMNRVKQVASARFGVTAEYLVSADELEIKVAQGSKPGEGGQLPATKVTEYIATLRHAVANMTLISPPPHHDIYSIEDLAQLIYDLREINPTARIGVKLVATAGVGIIAAGVAKAGADVITISGHDGGTGASPLSSIKNTAIPWEVGITEAHLALLAAGLRKRVRLRVDGGLRFSRDVIVAALLGADEFGFGTAALLAIGCVMARQCHLNTCPVGIASQDEKYRVRFTGQPEMVMNFFRALAAETRQTLARLGTESLASVVGAVERLRPRSDEAARVVEPLLRRGSYERMWSSRVVEAAPLSITTTRQLPTAPPRRDDAQIRNSDRSVGAELSGELVRRTRLSGVPALSAEFDFSGIAGQSFGAFLVSGLKFRLHGEANDYVGKGLSGGTIAISAGAKASARGDVLAGNALLYGATSGRLFIAGRTGERFAVRNSGALAVVEGVGQHGCEYMTAGVVIVLGPVGKNFGAGMTGGLAYGLAKSADALYNRDFVRFDELDAHDCERLVSVLRLHVQLTGSPVAKRLLRRDLRSVLRRIQPVQLPCPIGETWTRAVGPVRDRKPAPMLPSPRDNGESAVL